VPASNQFVSDIHGQSDCAMHLIFIFQGIAAPARAFRQFSFPDQWEGAEFRP